MNRHASTALAAPQEPGERSTGRLIASTGVMRLCSSALAALYGRPSLWVNDREIGSLGVLPLRFRIHAAHALAVLRIEDHTNPVPDDISTVKGVDEDPVSAGNVPIDGACVPLCSAGWLHAFMIQGSGDLSRRLTREIIIKYASHDLGLIFDDLKLAGMARNGPISVGLATGIPTVAYNARHSPTNLVFKVLEKHRSDQAPDTDLYMIRATIMDAHEINAEKTQPLVNAGQVFLIATDAVQSFDNHDVEIAIARIPDQPLNPGTPVQ